MSMPPAGPTPPGYDPTGAAPPPSMPDPAASGAPSDPVAAWQPDPPAADPTPADPVPGGWTSGGSRPGGTAPEAAAPGADPYASRARWADGPVIEGGTPPPAWRRPERIRRRRWPVLVGVAATCVLFLLAGVVAVGLLWTRAATPDATGGDVDHGPLRQSNYHDWHFTLDDVKLDATKTGGRDLHSCTPVEHDRALTAQGCRSGIELDYRTAGDRIRLEQFVLVFDTAAHARRAGRELTGDQLQLRRSKLHPHAEGTMVRQSTGQYLVITVGTAANGADDDRRDTFVHYANADMTAAMIWRD